MSKEYIPYTYYIGWPKLNVWYYGCEYSNSSKVANPSNLWTIYFTSSKQVKKFRKKYGEPDIIKVHKFFTNKNDALYFEEQFLLNIKAAQNKKWLNRHNGGKNFYLEYHSKETKDKFKNRTPWNKDISLTNEHKEKIKINHQSKKDGYISPNKGRKFSEEFCENNRNAQLARNIKQTEELKIKRKIYEPRSKESNIKRSEAITKLKWYNNGIVNKRLISPIDENWVLGRVHK